MTKKYIVVKGSITSHCCFEFSVILEGSDDAICECYYKEHADKIADALNFCASTESSKGKKQ